MIRVLIASALYAIASVTSAVTISGQITINSNPLANVTLAAPKATCTNSDAGGNYSCTVPASWNGTLAPYLHGYTFSPPSISYSSLSANQNAQSFAGTIAFGLRAELGVYRPSASQFFLDYNLDHTADATLPFGTPGDIGLVGDLDGNGVSDLVVYRNGIWYTDFNISGIAGAQYAFGGVAGDVPLLGDLNGDGVDDLVIYRNGTWYVSTQRNGVADRIYNFGGVPGDVPLLGDFDGDGVADLVIFRNGVWYIDTNRDGIPDIIAYFGGVAGEIPLVLDFDGDGRSDLAVFRNGVWYINTQMDGTVQANFIYGTTGDRPIAGLFNRANTLFVKAGGTCTSSCSQNDPFGSIQGAWQAAIDGTIIRVAGGTYAENLVFTYPGFFGKNNIKLLGASRNSTIVSPASGDALYLRGASGYVLRKLRFQSGDLSAGNGRGIVLAGGPGSVLPPDFPGAQASIQGVDVVDNHDYNVLLTGTSNALVEYSKFNRSKTRGGLTLWQASYANIRNSEASNNGYTLVYDPAISIPDGGKGIDVRDDSEVLAKRNSIQQNSVFGVIGINQSVVRLDSNTIASTGLDGIIVCGAAANDQTVAYVTNNWVAANGTNRPDLGWNGMEAFASCLGTHTVTGNTFIGNTLNGLFVGSGTAFVTRNVFKSNRIGITLYSDTTAGSNSSSTNTNVTLYNNLVDGNALDGLYAQRVAGTTFSLNASVGGTQPGQQNTFQNQQGLHAIGCQTGTENLMCLHVGNTFANNINDIEASCPATCIK